MTPGALNYHHLLYFWAVAKEGSLRRASEVLHVSQPSISAQLKQLEESLGAPLFTRTTRRLILTDTGQRVLEYAEEIFSLGRELLTAVRQEPGERPLRLHVGVADSVPKIIVRQHLTPVFELGRLVRVICREGSLEELITQLAGHKLDVVLADEPSTNRSSSPVLRDFAVPSFRIYLVGPLLIYPPSHGDAGVDKCVPRKWVRSVRCGSVLSVERKAGSRKKLPKR